MTVLDSVEVWLRSSISWLEAAGVVVHFDRPDADRLNPSCVLNLRREDLEVDLIVWESGEAELALVGRDGEVEQEHLENLADVGSLVGVLQRVLRAVSLV